MKNALLVLAMLVGSSAYANLAAPVYSCRLEANVSAKSSVELLIVRGETLVGRGQSVCMDVLGQSHVQQVEVLLQTGGVGPAFNAPGNNLQIYAGRAGVTGVNTMAGRYNVGVGARLGFLTNRSGLLVGSQISGQGVGAGVEVSIENRASFGVDVTAATLSVLPLGPVEVIKTRY